MRIFLFFLLYHFSSAYFFGENEALISQSIDSNTSIGNPDSNTSAIPPKRSSEAETIERAGGSLMSSEVGQRVECCETLG